MYRFVLLSVLTFLTALAPEPSSAASVMDATTYDRYVGRPEAPRAMVVYSSPTCSHCVDFERQVLPEIQRRYVDTGQFRIAYRPYLRNAIDAVIFMVVESVDNAKKEKTFAAFTSRYEEIIQSHERERLLRQISADVGIDNATFDQVVANQAVLDKLNQITERAGQEFDVEGTPAFFLDGKQVRNDGTIHPFEDLME